MACLRGKHLVQLALQSHKLEVPANQNKLQTPSIVKDKSSVQDKTVHYKIQGSDLEVIDTHKYDTYFPVANKEMIFLVGKVTCPIKNNKMACSCKRKKAIQVKIIQT